MVEAGMADSERLFFALWPEPWQQAEWTTMAQQLIPSDAGRLVPSQNLHVTLLYLGEVKPQIRQAMERLAGTIKASSFCLRLEQIGYWRRPQVLWWGAKQTPEQLKQLVRLLQRGAENCGLELDRRPYKAHLTLARKVRRPPGHLSAQCCDWQVKQFALVRSTLSPEGAQYEVLRRWPLLKQPLDRGNFQM